MSYSFHQVISLRGPNLVLTPILESELGPAALALVNETTWFSRTRNIKTPSAFVEYFGPRLKQQESGEILTLVARNKATNEIVGMSTLQYPGEDFFKIEIGFTWVADKWQRTYVNSEMKLLIMTHAFEEMKTKRVEFCVHPNNEKSNAAMTRLGAKLEGTLRKWRYRSGTDDGNRNIYSVIDEEWPQVKAHLQKKLTQSS
jgi:RimJ/RimL family protein N-acetyltransferase